MSIDVHKLEDMTLAELEKLEDETVLLDGENSDDSKPALEEPAKVDDVVVVDKPVVADEAQSVVIPEETKVVAPVPGEDEITKHVSPPSKWAEDRRAKRDLQTQLDEVTAQAAKSDGLETELGEVKAQLDWMKTAIQSKGLDLPSAPIDVFNDEKIEEVRSEFGDELADMLKATAVMLAKQNPAVVTPDVIKPDTPAPVAEVIAPVAAPVADPALMKAIDDNDELAYWKENSQPLWDKAVATDASLLLDPAYAGLPYAERFAKVVEAVKLEVTTKATPEQKSEEGKPPESLSDSGGVAPTPISNDVLEKILSADNPDAQLKIYDSLSQAQKDEVDKALNI
jgi:hypothetical protein